MAKTVVAGPTNNGDGTYSLTYRIYLENSGSESLLGVQVTDDLQSAFTGATSFGAISVSSSNLALNPAFDGSSDPNVLAGSDSLGIGGSGFVDVSVTVNPGANLGPYANSATGSATSSGGSGISDVSTTGANPDQDGNGDPTDDSTPTSVSFSEAPEIGAAKSIVSGPTNNGNGTYSLTYRILVVNSGDVPVNSVQLTDNLTAAFAGATGFSVNTVTGSGLTANPLYNGTSTTSLLAGANTLATGASGSVDIQVTVTPGTNLGPHGNSATGSATSAGGAALSDVSAAGASTDPNGNGDPTDDSAPTNVTFTESPEIGLAKRIFAGPTNNGDGTYSVTYRVRVENTGDVPIHAIQITDDLAVAFSGATGFAVGTMSGNGLAPNPLFNGTTNTSLLTGANTLATGAIGRVDFQVTVTPGAKLGPYANSATGSATSAGGAALSDVSTVGLLADANGNGDPTDDSTPTNVTFSEAPELGMAKSVVSGPTNNGNGTYTLTYQIRVENGGDVPINNVQVADNLAATFAGATGMSVNTVTGSGLAPNPLYNGSTNTNLLTGANALATGASGSVDIRVTVTPGANLGPYANSATGSATSAGGTALSDMSTQGSNPDPNGNGNPADDSTPTSVTFTESPRIGVAKAIVSGPANNGNGTYTLTYRILVANSGDVPVNSVQLTDNLVATFAGATSFSVNTVTGSGLTPNALYNGTTNTSLLSGANTLATGVSGSVDLQVTVTPGANLGPYANSATGSATSAGGSALSDVSTQGSNPDPNGNGNPADDSTPTSVSFTESPRIGVAKAIVSGPTNNGNGTYTLTYRVLIVNSGDVPVNSVQLTDNLTAAFTGATDFSVNTVTGSGLVPNPLYNGTSNTNLLTGANTLATGASGSVGIQVTVTPGTKLGSYANSATGSATSAGGSALSDVSTQGSNPDPNGNGNPADDSTPTSVTFTESPRIGVAKAVISGPTNNGNGTYTLTYQIRVENSGDVPINSVQVADNLAATFAGATGFSVSAVTGSGLTPNTLYNGTTNTSLLSGANTLATGASGSVDFQVTVTTGTRLGPYANSATGSATSAGGAALSDVSTQGSNPDTNGNGNPADDSTPTSVTFTESPRIGVAKAVISGPSNNGNGTYSLTYRVLVVNSGDVPVNSVQLTDNLVATFAGATGFSVNTVTGSGLAPNPLYNGATNTNLLTGANALATGASGSVDIQVTVTPGTSLGPYANSATGSATSAGGAALSDVSTTGSNPDPNGNGNPADDSTPTSVSFSESPRIGVAKDVIFGPSNNGNGTYSLTYRILVANSGDVPVHNLQVTDNLATTFAVVTGFSVDAVTGGGLTPNPLYNGTTNTNLLMGADALATGATATVDLQVTVTPGENLVFYNNSAVGIATSSGGSGVSDISTAGADPDPNGNGDPADDSTPTEVSFSESPRIGVAKAIVSDPTNNGNGTYSLTYRILVENSGDVPIHGIQLTDNLGATFAGATGFSVDAVTGSGLTSNLLFNGTTNVSLLAGANSLAPGTNGSVDLQVTVTPGANLGPYGNSATGSATSPGGMGLTDVSAAGATPDANGNGNPVDDNAPTLVNFSESPRIGVAKAVVAGPTNNGDGTHSFTYRILIVNSGDVPVHDVQVTDDLSTTFTGAAGFSVTTVTGSGLTPNPLYNGTTNASLLLGTDLLSIGGTGSVDLQLTVTPGTNLGPYANSANGSATSAGGARLSDASAAGEIPDANGNGNPADDSTPTSVTFIESPRIGVAKAVVAGPTNNGNGTYSLTYRVLVANHGDVSVSGVQLTDNLAAAFAGATRFSVNSVTGNGLAANTLYNGTTITNLLMGANPLAIGASGSVDLRVTVTPGANLGPYGNSVTGSATSASGAAIADVSTAGSNPDENGNGDPADDSEPTPVSFSESPRIGVAKRIIAGPTNNGDGTHSLTYRIRVENNGDVPIASVQVTDSLTKTFFGATGFSVNSVSAMGLAPNLLYDGTTNTSLLLGTNTLAPGASGRVDFAVTVTPGANPGPYGNNATGSATSTGGVGISDVSAAGALPDANGNGDPGDDSAPTNVSFSESPEIGVAKSVVTGPINNGDGTYSHTFRIRVENSGDVPVNGVQLTDNLTAAFAGAAAVIVDSVTGSGLTTNPLYDGTTNTSLLVGSDTLAPGTSGTIDLQVTVTPGVNLGPYSNQATGTGTSSGGIPLSDVSTAGSNPDANGNGNPTDDTTPTSVTFGELPRLGVAKALLSVPVNHGDGSYTLTYRILLSNSGDVPVHDVQLTDNLATTFASATGFTVDAVTASGLAVNPLYNGTTNHDLLSGTDLLATGASGSIDVQVTVIPGTALGPYGNSATGNGTSAGGSFVTDTSTDGVNPDANGNGNPADDSTPTSVTFSETPRIGVAKSVVQGPTNNGNGTYSLTYRVFVANSGDVPVQDVQVTDDLAATFSGAAGFTVDTVSGSGISVNPLYNGTVDASLLLGTDFLSPGESGSIDLTVTATPGANLGPYANTATGNATSIGGAAITDASAQGSNPDANGNGDPGDDSAPTSVSFTESPEIGVAKTILSGPAPNGDGTHTLTYRIRIENSGDVPVLGVQVTDNLAATFAAASAFAVDALTGTGLATNPLYDGTASTGLLVGTDVLAPGASGSIDLRVTVTPNGNLGPFANGAIGGATSDGGATLSDASAEGSNPDANGNGDPSDDSTPTSVTLGESPEIGVAKAVVSGPIRNMDDTYTLTFRVRFVNGGDVPVHGVQLTDNLATTFMGAAGFTVDSVTGSGLTVNPSYDGSSNSALLTGMDVVAIGGSGSVDLRVSVTPDGNLGPYDNVALGLATSVLGASLFDVSTNGSNPDANGNGDPTDDTTLTRVTFGESPEIGVAKDIVAGPTRNGNGTHTLTYRIRIENSGDYPVHDVQLADDLLAAFGGATNFSVDALTGTGLTTNPLYNGRTDIRLLAGTDVLGTGATAFVDLRVIVKPGTNLGPYTNSATGSATSLGGATLSDVSADGSTPDTNGNGNPGDDSTPTSVTFVESPMVGVAKALVAGPVNNGDGSYTVTYRIRIENSGDVPVHDVQLADNLVATFAGASGFTVDSVTGSGIAANPLFDGAANSNLLAGTDVLAPGASGSVDLRITVAAGTILGPYANTATGRATSLGGVALSDVSTAGADPDANGNGSPMDDSTPTTVTFGEAPELGIAKRVTSPPVNNGDGTYTLTYRMLVQNSGDVTIHDVQVTDDLAATFAGAAGFVVDAITGNGLATNSLYDGTTNRNLLLGSDVLAPGANGSIDLRVIVTPGGNLGPYANSATGSGTSAGGAMLSDASAAGSNPDANGNGNPADDGTPTSVSFTESAEIGVAKTVASGPANNGDGTYTLTYRIRIENSGDVPVEGVQLTDDLAATFAGAAGFVVDTITGAGLAANALYDGTANTNLLAGTDVLAPGGNGSVDLRLTVTPGANLGPYANSATGSASSAGGAMLTDASAAGSNPDPNANGDPADDSTPTSLSFSESAEIGVAKAVVTGPTNNGDGTYTVTYRIRLENSGDVAVHTLQLMDDLAATFTGSSGFVVDAVTGTGLAANGLYDGRTNTNLLAGTDGLLPGGSGSVDVRVTVSPGANFGPYHNHATGTGISTGGASLSDISTSGLVPDADGNGDPADDAEATSLFFGENPEIGLAKAVLITPVNHGDGTYTLVYTIMVENSGDVGLDSIQVHDDCRAAFALAQGFAVDQVLSNDFTVDSAYDGVSSTKLLIGTDSLAPGERGAIAVTVTVTPGTRLGPYSNTARVRATSPSGIAVNDLSTEGREPDANGDGNPATDSTPTDITFAADPIIGIAKSVSGAPVDNGDGSFGVTYLVTIENSGDIVLRNVQVTDSLSTTFGAATGFSVSNVTSATLSANPAFDGTGAVNLLSGGDTLMPGQKATVAIELTVLPGIFTGPYMNGAVAMGTSPSGMTVLDLSTSGTEPDANGNGDPRDDTAPTPVTFDVRSRIGAAKSVLSGPTNMGDGTYRLTYLLRIENLGQSTLRAIRMSDDLGVTFAAAQSFVVDAVRSAKFALDPTYDGRTNVELLAGSDSLVAGDAGAVEVDITVRPGTSMGPYDNTAFAQCTIPGGAVISDASADGLVADTNGNGDPSDDQEPTRVRFDEVARIGLAKAVQRQPEKNADGTWGITYVFFVRNMGDVSMRQLQVTDDLAAVYPAGYRIESLSSPELSVNSSFDGAAERNLLAGTDSLAAGQVGTIVLALSITHSGDGDRCLNSAFATAVSPALQLVNDASTAGPNPDPDGNGDPTDNQEPTGLTFPLQSAAILLSMSADRRTVESGDFVRYTLEAENTTAGGMPGIVIRDLVPAGFTYAPKSGKILRADQPSAAFEPHGAETLEFPAFDLGASEKVHIEFYLLTGSGVGLGEHVNRATAYQNDVVVANTATASVERVSDPVLERTTLIGKIFHDRNGDGWQSAADELGIDGLDEEGIPGVRLATATGLVIETDAHGRYHIADVDAGFSQGRNFILKVDPASLPASARFTTENPRILHLTPGLMSRIDFGVEFGIQEPTASALQRAEARLRFEKSVQPWILEPVWEIDRPETIVLEGDTFQAGKSDFTKEAGPRIAKLAERLAQDPEIQAAIEAHTDKAPIQSLMYKDNYDLSIARSRAIMYELVLKHGIAADRLFPVGYGPDRPVDPGKSREAGRKNRRIEVKLIPAHDDTFRVVGVKPDKIELRLHVRYSGDLPLEAVEIDDNLPAGMTYVQGSSRLQDGEALEPVIQESADGTLLRWTVPALDPSVSIVYRARVLSIDPSQPLGGDARLRWRTVEGDSGASSSLRTPLYASETQPHIDLYTLGPPDFATKNAGLSASGEEALELVSQSIKEFDRVRILVEGHTENQPIAVPKFRDNVALSEARARSVKESLQRFTGLPDSVFVLCGYGSKRPVDNNFTPVGRQRNQRVEITLRGWKTPEPEWMRDTARPAANAAHVEVPIRGFRTSAAGQPGELGAAPGAVRRAGTDARGRVDGDTQRPSLRLAAAGAQGSGPAAGASASLASNAARESASLPWGGSVWVIADPEVEVPRLEVRGPDRLDAQQGGATRFTVTTNYAAFIQAWEIALFRGTDGDLTRPVRTLSGRGLQPQQVVEWDGRFDSGVDLSTEGDLLYVLRVYDDQSHMDETMPGRIQLVQGSDRDAGAESAPSDERLRVQSIPVRGGRVRIHGAGIPPDVRMRVANQEIQADAEGNFDLALLLPSGERELPVAARNAAGAEWGGALRTNVKDSSFFLVGIADLSLGDNQVSGDPTLTVGDPTLDDSFFGTGRLAFYLKGLWRGKYRATAQLDTREEEIGEVFGNFDRKDPRSVFRHLDPDRFALTYGDGSTTIADVNSQGRLYARLDWDKSQLLWGNYTTGLTGTEFAQYNRSLYGAALRHRSLQVTSQGESRVEGTAFASEAQTALGHNEFLGTGSSLYYLEHNDVVQGSEKVWVEVRDRDSDRVIENVALVRERDYEIDELQGRILLHRPLMQVADQIAPSIIKDTPLEGNRVLLLVDYEYVPAAFDAGQATAGVRGRVWATDGVALGGTYVQENRETEDYQLAATDIILRSGRGTYLKTEYAKSQADQSGANSYSGDGGFTFEQRTNLSPAIEGEALGFEGKLDLGELLQRDDAPQLGAWWKQRDAGFSTARLNTPLQSELYGAELLWRPRPRLAIGSRWSETNTGGVLADRSASLQAEYRFPRWQLGGELRQRQEESPLRTDATLGGLRLGFDLRPGTNIYSQAQATLRHDDNEEANNLGTLGLRSRLGNKLDLRAEASSGNRGNAARFGADLHIDPRHDLFGTYTLSTDRVDGKRGTLSLGQRQTLSNQLRVFTDHQFTHGEGPSGSTQAYGLTLEPRKDWSLSASYQSGDLADPTAGLIDRETVSAELSLRRPKRRLSLKGEVRDDDGAVDRRQWLTANRLDLDLADGWTLLAKASFSRTDDRSAELADAQFVESGIGLAYRPVRHSRMNMLSRYTFLYDLPAPTQSMRADERAHVVSVEAGYDLTRRWELGGRLAVKSEEIRTVRDGGEWLPSRPRLGVVRARYHLGHAVDAVGEYRWLWNPQAGDQRNGALLALYRDLTSSITLGAGFNATSFSADLTDRDHDAYGWFIRLIGRQ